METLQSAHNSKTQPISAHMRIYELRVTAQSITIQCNLIGRQIETSAPRYTSSHEASR